MQTVKSIDLKAKDGRNLKGYTWGDLSQAKAILVLVHGVGEHVRRYDHVAAAATARGMAMIGIDQRGFGSSGGKPGVVGSSAALMSDITTVIEQARQANPTAPVFLYGHSMGALEVLYYGLTEKPRIAGVIATSPPLSTATLTQTQITLTKLLSGILPNLTIPSNLSLAGLSRDQKIVDDYKADPLVHDKVSVALGKFFYEGALFVMNHAAEWKLPLYLAHGSEDKLCPISGSKEFFSKLSGDVTFKVWEGLYHETHNEPEKELVLATMLDWVEARL